MAFDAGMIAAVADELQNRISGARIEKVNQPEKDEIVLALHTGKEKLKLVISSAADNPRIHLTEAIKENPLQAPMFCMLLRKHITGAKIGNVSQMGFERVIEIEINAYDEMGFSVKRYLICEVMGKYSNIIFANEDKKIMGAIKIVDFTTSQKRQILCGMKYEAPPSQDKLNPLTVSKADFERIAKEKSDYFSPNGTVGEKFITSGFFGISTVVARDIVYSAVGGNPWNEFEKVISVIKEKSFTPALIAKNGTPADYFFYAPTYYGGERLKYIENDADIPSDRYYAEKFSSASELLDRYFGERDRDERRKQHERDLIQMLGNVRARLEKKISLQQNDLASCADKEKYKYNGDLITTNMWLIKKGMEQAALTDYYSEDLKEITVKLEPLLTPAQNAQKYYKKYNKAKSAEIELTKQIAIANAELEYIETVSDALTRCENEQDIEAIREELSDAGFASKIKGANKNKRSKSKPAEYITSGGFTVFCGKNNVQNDNLTTKAATKHDWWFHVKNMPGSHTVMLCDDDVEPSERDFTEAAIIAAVNSKACDGFNVAVDYTKIKNIKKPSGAKPGFVTYSANWTAYVTPDKKLAESLRKK